MSDLVALGVQTPQINTVGNFEASQNNAIQQQGAEMQQHAAALEQIAQMGLGIMGGKLDGPIDPEKLKQGIALLGNNPLAAKLAANPELLRTITSGSMNVLQYAQNQAQFKLAMEQFDRQLQSTDADIALKQAETTQINNGGKIIGGQPVTMSDGSVAYPTEYGGLKTVSPGGGSVAPPPAAPAGIPPGPMGAAPAATTATTAPMAIVGTPDGGMAPSVGGGTTPAATAPPHILTPAEVEAQKTKAGEQAKLDVQKPKEMVAAKSALDQLDQQDAITSQSIDAALKEVPAAYATGFVGKLTEQVPGSPAYKLARIIDTIRANVGFDKLQAMRAASPNGGALGQVSNFEEQLLQSVLGSLDQGQDAATLTATLNRLKTFLASNHQQRLDAFNADFSGILPPSGDKTFNAPEPANTNKPVDMGNGITIEELP